MDKKKSILNITISICSRIIALLETLVIKRILIEMCGNEVNGLNALYSSIIGILAVVDLGVGSAIGFCMYKPIVDGDEDKVAALYHLFRRIYSAIGIVILVGGLAITPFIHHLAKDFAQINVNMQLTFALTLITVVVSYFYGAEISLINAYKNNYITTALSTAISIFGVVFNVVVLIQTQSFASFLTCRLIFTIISGCAMVFVARKKYGRIISNRNQKLDTATKQKLTRSIKAMFMHKIGTLLVNTVDSVVISAFVGVIVLGEYSNYSTIQTSMDGIIALIFTSLTSVLGHLYVQKSKHETKVYFERFHLLNFAIGIVFYLGYYAIVDNLVAILFSASLVVEKSISFVITMNGFVQYMRKSALVFRDATGAFYNDRWKPLIEGCVNIILSILFVKWIGVTGVIVATILTNLLICHVIEPYVLYKNAFEESPGKHFLKNYGMIMVFTIALFVLNCCLRSYESQWVELLVNGCISVGISFLVCVVVVLLSWKNSKAMIMTFLRRK